MPEIQVRRLDKSYGGAPLLRNVSFNIAPREIVCLLGPSGTGKTTLLRILAGLEEPEGGEVLLDGRNLAGVPVHRRGFGLMFQDLALFPHRSVYDNVAFGLRMQNLRAPEIKARVEETLSLVGLEPARFARRDVNRLSGGEQQRVALARSLAPRPQFLMFDEPLGALDRILREQLVADLRALLKDIGMTALYVTHDQEEAFAIADRLVILHLGRVQQEGAPTEVYRQPANAFVARFLGLTNLLPARIVARAGALARTETALGAFEFESAAPVGAQGYVLIRPAALRALLPNGATETNSLRGEVVQALLRAGHTRIVVTDKGVPLTFEWEGPIEVGQEAVFALKPGEISFVSQDNQNPPIG